MYNYFGIFDLIIISYIKLIKTMSKKDDLMVLYRGSLNDKCGVSNIDEALLETVVKGLGPSIYLADASKVSCTDDAEIKRVKDNFCAKKLGMTDESAMAAACNAVCEQMGSSNKSKYRAVFYYLLCEHTGKRPA